MEEMHTDILRGDGASGQQLPQLQLLFSNSS